MSLKHAAIPRDIHSTDGPNMVIDTHSIPASNQPPTSSAHDTIRSQPQSQDNRANSKDALPVEESMEDRIERLGRARPEVFSSTWSEIGFVFALAMSQVLSEYFVSGFTVIVPTLVKSLSIPAASSTWPASAFSLTVACFLLVFGRIADMYGGYPVFVAGMVWLAVWSLIGGFSTNEIMMNFCRALQGLGPAAFLPSSMMILGSIYRPGPRKNVVFSVYGACAPLGFFIGIFFAGVTGEYASWNWYFYIGTILAAATAVAAYLTIPSDIQEKKNSPVKVEMDWLGSILIVIGLILFTFAIIDSSHAPGRWNNPYVYTLLIIGSLVLFAAAYVEVYIAHQPLLPASLFKIPSMPALIIALFFTWGSFGIFLLYTTFYMQYIMAATQLQVVAWYTPMALGGCMISTFGGFILHLLPGTILIIIAGTSWIIAPLLFALAPQGASYWAYVFPSMICATIGVDITFSVTNLFVSRSLPKHQQGLAGSVIMILVHLGIAVFLGFADILNTYTGDRLGTKKSYQAVFWYEVACAAVALVVLVGFVKIKKAKSEMTFEERNEMEAAAAAASAMDAAVHEKKDDERPGTAG